MKGIEIALQPDELLEPVLLVIVETPKNATLLGIPPSSDEGINLLTSIVESEISNTNIPSQRIAASNLFFES